jgi:ubiquinone biosynthesis protein
MFKAYKNYRLLRRYQQIAQAFSRFGFGELIGRLNLWGLFKFKRLTPQAKEQHQSRAVRFRLMLEHLGPTFIKLGQVLSTRPDLLPEEFVAELGHLQDRVTPMPWDQFRRQLKTPEPIERMFAEFDPHPIASASIAQVYQAKLKTGERVAVKIIRPGTEKIIADDLAILEHMAGWFQAHIVETRHWNLPAVIDQFRRSVSFELDLHHEGRNADIFRSNFDGDSTLYVPKIYWDYSHRNILTMEFIEGRPITDYFDPAVDFTVRRTLADRGAKAVLKQIFEHGFFHADPHPGNAMILPGQVICFLDFGMFGRLDDQAMDVLARVLHAVVKKDVDRLMKAARDLGVLPDRQNQTELRVAVLDLLEQYHGLPLKHINVPQMLRDIVHLVSRHRLGIRHDFLFLIKALGAVESTGRKLDPDFDMLSHIEPFVRAMLLKRFSPGRVLDNAQRVSEDLSRLARETPEHVLEILRRASSGQMRFDFRHQGLEEPFAQLNRMSDKLVLGIIIGALIIASALMAHAQVGPKLYGYPVVGGVSFLIAAVAGLWIVIDILRSRRR